VRTDTLRGSRPLSRANHWIKAFVRSLINDDVMVLAASIAYASVLSLFPLLIGLIALFSRLLNRVDVQDRIISSFGIYLPPRALQLLRETITAVVQTRGQVGLVALVGLFWSATAAGGALRHALNRILRVQRERPFWRAKLVDLMAVLVGAGGFLSVSVLAGAAATASGPVNRVALLAWGMHEPHVRAMISLFVSWFTAVGAFFIAYRFLPHARVTPFSLVLGSVLVATLFEGLKRGFFWYLRTLASYPLVYGPLAGLVVFMVWVYLVSALLLVGAAVMREVDGAIGFGATNRPASGE
jgi:membrane protein